MNVQRSSVWAISGPCRALLRHLLPCGVSRRTPRVPASATANLRKRRIQIDAEPEDLQSLELGPRSRARFGTGYPVAGVRRESDLLAAASDERVGRKSNRDKIGRFPRLGVGVVSRCVSRLSWEWDALCARTNERSRHWTSGAHRRRHIRHARARRRRRASPSRLTPAAPVCRCTFVPSPSRRRR